MSKKQNQIDPRLAAVAMNRQPQERFMILALGALIGQANPDALAEILETVQPQGMDYTQTVEGKPLHHWLGKTQEQITAEIGGDEERADAIISALQDNGLTVVSDDDVTGRPGDIPGERSAADEDEAANRPPRRQPAENQPPRRQAAKEPSFGRDQIPLSELPESDEEILKIPGIGEATLAEIKKARGEK